MPKTIPTLGQTGWGAILNDHLAQISNPTTGGINVWTNSTRPWQNGDTTKGEFANRTGFNEETGVFERWVTGNSAEDCFWRELGKAIKASQLELPGNTTLAWDLADFSQNYPYLQNSTLDINTLVEIGDIIQLGTTPFYYQVVSQPATNRAGVTIIDYNPVIALSSPVNVTNVTNSNTFTAPVGFSAEVGDKVTFFAPNSSIQYTSLYITEKNVGGNPNVYRVNINFPAGWGSPTDIKIKTAKSTSTQGKVSRPINKLVDLSNDTKVVTNSLGSTRFDNGISSVIIEKEISKPVLESTTLTNGFVGKYFGIRTGNSVTNHVGTVISTQRTIGQLVNNNASSTPSEWEGTMNGTNSNLRLEYNTGVSLSNTTSLITSNLNLRSNIRSGRTDSFTHINIFPLDYSSATTPSNLGTISDIWGIWENGAAVGHPSVQREAKNFFQGKTQFGSDDGNPFSFGAASWAGVDEQLVVRGNIKYYGSLINASDQTLKKEITTLDQTESLNKISALKGVSYKWENQEMTDTAKHLGLIAQEVELIYPELVVTGTDGKKNVRYLELIAPMIESIKLLKDEIDTLKSEIKSLKGE